MKTRKKADPLKWTLRQQLARAKAIGDAKTTIIMRARKRKKIVDAQIARGLYENLALREKL